MISQFGSKMIYRNSTLSKPLGSVSKLTCVQSVGSSLNILRGECRHRLGPDEGDRMKEKSTDE